MITLNDVTKQFEDGDTIIDAVKTCSLSLDKGTFAAIIGPSGSGKSTLLTMMGALQKPSTGSLKIDHIDVYDQKEALISEMRLKHIGFVLQGSNLVPYLTIREQFELKKRVSHVEETYDMHDLFELLDITHIQQKYPDQISGGERQRAAIGLSLYLKPKIILADEPTASLDTQRAITVIDLLRDISKKLDTTVVMVTHDTRMITSCDAVFEMNDGILTQQR